MKPLIISGPAGTRTIRAGELPLRIGRGARMDLRVPGPADERVIGLISLLEGRPLLQKLTDDPPLAVNGETFGPTRWLADDDVVTAESLRIECHFNAGAWGLTVAYTDTEYPTVPPAELPGARPAARRRATAAPASQARPARRRVWLICGTLLAIGAVLATLFLLRR